MFIDDTHGPDYTLTGLIEGFAGPCTIVRTLLWVRSSRITVFTTSDSWFEQVPSPMYWSFRETGSVLNPGEPPSQGAWDDDGHYLGVGALSFDHRPLFEPQITNTTGDTDVDLSYTEISNTTGQRVVLSTASEYVDSHARRVVTAPFVYASFSVSQSNAPSNVYTPTFSEMECDISMLFDFPD
jgi:hypothetical protein